MYDANNPWSDSESEAEGTDSDEFTSGSLYDEEDEESDDDTPGKIP